MCGLRECEIAALDDALDDEYQAWVTYDQVIADFGEVMPFVNIHDAEARHIEALLVLFRSYGLAVPDNNWPRKVPRFGSLHDACEAGVLPKWPTRRSMNGCWLPRAGPTS